MDWIEASLNSLQAASPEGRQWMLEHLTESLNLKTLAQLIETVQHTLDLLETHNGGRRSEGLLADLLNEDIETAFQEARQHLYNVSDSYNRTCSSDLLSSPSIQPCVSLHYRKFNYHQGLVYHLLAWFLFTFNYYITNLPAKDIALAFHYPISFAAVIQGAVPLGMLLVLSISVQLPVTTLRIAMLVTAGMSAGGNLLCVFAVYIGSALCYVIGRIMIGGGMPALMGMKFIYENVPVDEWRKHWSYLLYTGIGGLVSSIVLSNSVFSMDLQYSFLSTYSTLLCLGLWLFYALCVALFFRDLPSMDFLSGLRFGSVSSWNTAYVLIALILCKTCQEAVLTLSPVLLAAVFGWSSLDTGILLLAVTVIYLVWQTGNDIWEPSTSHLYEGIGICWVGSLLLWNVTGPEDTLRFIVGLALLCSAGSLCDQTAVSYLSSYRSNGKETGLRLLTVAAGLGRLLGNGLVVLSGCYPKEIWSDSVCIPLALFSTVSCSLLLVCSRRKT